MLWVSTNQQKTTTGISKEESWTAVAVTANAVKSNKKPLSGGAFFYPVDLSHAYL